MEDNNNSTGSTGKTYSVWMEEDVASVLANEAVIQNTNKSKIVRVALLRYADEMKLDRNYVKTIEEIRSKNYE